MYKKPFKLHLKTGALRRQLKIPKDKKIPPRLLEAIIRTRLTVTKNGKKTKLRSKTIKNPTAVGSKEIIVTPLLQKRGRFAYTMITKWNGRCKDIF